ncbi:MAG TPA: hypothetical protein VGS06_07455 [Streptosporangiaceae bacterium]|nr:hypothetical protein [Streptosporangiaceae bacterium]
MDGAPGGDGERRDKLGFGCASGGHGLREVLRLAFELVVDDVMEPEDLRAEQVRRFALACNCDRTPPRRRHGISPA